ncbi:MAG TPA: hypothetical protein VIK32_03775 [Candidatus Limnocylindrales bacterium]
MLPFIPGWFIFGLFGCASMVFSGQGATNQMAPFSAYGTSGVAGGMLFGAVAGGIAFLKGMS